MSLLEFCQWLEQSQIGTGIRESAYFFPIIESMHVLGLAMSVGMVIWFDLRLLGLSMRGEPVSQVFGHFKPWMLIGFTIMFTTGGLLFWSRASQAYASRYFAIKLLFLFLAGVNLAVYHLTIDRRRHEWDKAPTPPLQARLAGFVSIVLWLGVVAAGRIMAYTL